MNEKIKELLEIIIGEVKDKFAGSLKGFLRGDRRGTSSQTGFGDAPPPGDKPKPKI